MAFKTKTTKVIRVDWSKIASIRKAERMKSMLENKGYTLVGTANAPASGVSKLTYQR